MAFRVTVPIVGFVLGALLALAGLMLLLGVSDQVLLIAYAIVLILVSASLTSSAREGLILGLSALIGQALVDLVYVVFVYQALLLLPYAVGFNLFVGMIPAFPLAGALGGYLGGAYFAESKSKRRLGEKSRGPRGRG